MTRLIIVAAIALTLAAVANVGTADAAFWPAKCRNSATLGKFARCVDSHLNNLHKRLKAAVAVNATQTRRLNNHQAIFNCEQLVPITQYGDPAGVFGYEFNDGTNPTFFTTALDVTADGDPVGAWFVVDACEPTTISSRGILPRGVNLRPHLPAQ